MYYNKLTKWVLHGLTFLICSGILSACNGSGTTIGSTSNNSVAGKLELAVSANNNLLHHTQEFAYVIDSTASRIYMYSANAGTLTALSKPYIQMEPGSNPAHITIAPDKQCAYTANSGNNTISTYSIDQHSGILSTAGTISVSGSGQVQRVVITPNGKYAYSLSYDSSILQAIASIYSIDQTSGSLSQLTPGSIALGSSSNTVGAVDALSKHLYIGNGALSQNSSTKQYDPLKIYDIESDGQLIDSGHTTPSAG